LKKKDLLLFVGSTIGETITIIYGILVGKKLQIRFRDRQAAGNILGDIIKEEMNKIALTRNYSNGNRKLVVFGIPRGGVLTAKAVATKLSATLNIIVSRRLTAPHNEEITIGAVTGSPEEIYLNKEIIGELNISQDYIEKEKIQRSEEIKCRNLKFRRKTSTSLKDSITDKVVVLVDDGAASGATLIAALRLIKSYQPGYVIVGVPIAPRETVNMIRNEANKAISIFTPSNHEFVSVEQYYENYSPVTDSEVMEALRA
jgi:putative phosphoribosyl transferase